MMFFVLTCLAFSVLNAQKVTHMSPGRDVIVQLFEWKWKDVAEECERFLAKKNFGAVQISPPNENRVVTGRPWWERYQPISYKTITRSGNEADFRDMTTRCNKVGIRVYADVVFNHMASGDGEIVGTGGSVANVLNESFPYVPYSQSDFHKTCSINDYHNATEVRDCQLVGLKDLNQTTPYVRSKIVDYLNNLVDLGVAGFRIDAAKHMDPTDLRVIYDNVKDLDLTYGFQPNSRPFFYQEVIDKGGEAVSRDDYTPLGMVTEFRYGLFLGRILNRSDQLRYLINWGPEWGLVTNPRDALVFVNNHDTERNGGPHILNYKKSRLYKMANALMLAHPYGTPRITSGYKFDSFDQGPPHDNHWGISSPSFQGDVCTNGWTCTHRWRQIYNAVGFRNVVGDSPVEHFWFEPSNGQQISFCRGNKGFIAVSNLGDLRRKLRTCLPKGVYCDVISGNFEGGSCTGKTLEVDDDGWAEVTILEKDEDGVVMFHVDSKAQ